MQIKVFNIPVTYGESEFTDELNAFLRSRRVITMDSELVKSGGVAYWSFKIGYLDGPSPERDKQSRIDYREVLDAETYKRFSVLRDIRNKIAREESIPAYVVFSDEELAELSKISPLTMPAMKSVKGIGEKKVERYGQFFLDKVLEE